MASRRHLLGNTALTATLAALVGVTGAIAIAPGAASADPAVSKVNWKLDVSGGGAGGGVGGGEPAGGAQLVPRMPRGGGQGRDRRGSAVQPPELASFRIRSSRATRRPAFGFFGGRPDSPKGALTSAPWSTRKAGRTGRARHTYPSG